MLALDLAHDTRFQMAELRLDVIERRHRLDYVRIRVYGSHVFLGEFLKCTAAERPPSLFGIRAQGVYSAIRTTELYRHMFQIIIAGGFPAVVAERQVERHPRGIHIGAVAEAL
jgi:hypothetical protein